MSFRRESLPRLLAMTVAITLVSVASLIAMSSTASARLVVLPASAQGGDIEQFLVTAGPLPPEGGRLVLGATQTYEDGTVDRWTDPAPDPGAPGAPTIDLVPQPGAAPTDPSTTPDPSAPTEPSAPSTTAPDEAPTTDAAESSNSLLWVVIPALLLLAVAGVVYRTRRARTATASQDELPEATFEPEREPEPEPEKTSS
jgi:hypothetical protein